MTEYLREKLIKHLQDQPQGVWTPKGAITEIRFFHEDDVKQYLPETVGRELRGLESDSIIAVRGQGVSVEYRWMPESVRESYIPYSQREDKSILFKENI